MTEQNEPERKLPDWMADHMRRYLDSNGDEHDFKTLLMSILDAIAAASMRLLLEDYEKNHHIQQSNSRGSKLHSVFL